jgi:imidazolonepropionase-like amidohydrolase
MLQLIISGALAAAPLTQTWVGLTSTGKIAQLTAVTTGTSVAVDWKVDDNGRGPKITEKITLDARGFVVGREITGKAGYGAAVQERFAWADGKATWKSLDDRGEAVTGRPLYLDNNGSPWMYGQYVPLLSSLHVSSLPALPGGNVTIERLKEVDLGKPGAPDAVTAWAVGGIHFEPTLVLMRQDAFVGIVSPGYVLVEQRHAGDFVPLTALARALEAEFRHKLARALTHHVTEPLWLTNVHVFDSIAGKVGEQPVSVVVYRGVITGVRSDSPPPGAVVVDGQGGTLLPGLFDAHAHQSAGDGLLHLAAGVTFTRDPGNDNQSLLALTQAFDSGEFIGPRVWKSGFLEGKSPFSAQSGFVVSSVAEATEKLHWYADHGFWGVKIYNSMNPDFVKPIAAEAHRLGLHVSGHVPAFMTSERAVRDGYDEINHINQLLLGFLVKDKEDTRTPFRFTVIGERLAGFDLNGPAFKNMISLMKEKKVTLDPTIATFAPLILGRPGVTISSDVGFIDHLPPSERRGRLTAGLDLKPSQYATYDASWKKLDETLLTLFNAGIPLVPGTDDLAGLVLHSELEEWVRAGIPAGAALSAATAGSAKFLGQEQNLGVIARGRPADLYLVDGDPTKDITAIRKGRLVIKGESIFYPDELYSASNVTPFAPHLPVPGATP